MEDAIVLHQVRKVFGAKAAVTDLDLRVRAGSVFGLIGPNGAGKTTTFSMMAGFLQPTTGDIRILGHAPHESEALRARLGVLPQDAALPASDTVGDFLVFMARLQHIPTIKAIPQVRAALEEVGGKDWFSTRCGALSHGMAKRVQLAQALLGEPEVVLLDEPTAGLDPKIAHQVRELIKSRRGRCTMVISSHNLQELEEICDAAAILDRGRLVASGTMKELTAASEEVHITVSASTSVPVDAVRSLPKVARVDFDAARHMLSVYFERSDVALEVALRDVLLALLNQGVLVSAVTPGRRLEERVMELTG